MTLVGYLGALFPIFATDKFASTGAAILALWAIALLNMRSIDIAENFKANLRTRSPAPPGTPGTSIAAPQ